MKFAWRDLLVRSPVGLSPGRREAGFSEAKPAEGPLPRKRQSINYPGVPDLPRRNTVAGHTAAWMPACAGRTTCPS